MPASRARPGTEPDPAPAARADPQPRGSAATQARPRPDRVRRRAPAGLR